MWHRGGCHLAQGRARLALTSRQPQKRKVKVGFFQFDLKTVLILLCINFNFTVWRPEFAKFPKFFPFSPP